MSYPRTPQKGVVASGVFLASTVAAGFRSLFDKGHRLESSPSMWHLGNDHALVIASLRRHLGMLKMHRESLLMTGLMDSWFKICLVRYAGYVYLCLHSLQRSDCSPLTQSSS
jgi:hypothetical protein